MADCDDVLRELYRTSTARLTIEHRVRIEHHLDGCHACLETFDFQAELRQVIARKCHDPVPDTLRQRVMECLEGDDDQPDLAPAKPAPGTSRLPCPPWPSPSRSSGTTGSPGLS